MAEQSSVRKSNPSASGVKRSGGTGTRTSAPRKSSAEGTRAAEAAPSREPVSRAARTKREEARRRQKRHSQVMTITLLVILCLCAIAFASLFVSGLEWFREYMRFLFGIMMYTAPFFTYVLAWIFLLRDLTAPLVRRLIGFLIFLLAVHGIIAVSGGPEAGGLPGKLMELLVHSWLGNVGAYIIYIVMILTGFVLITDFSPAEWLHERTDPENERNRLRREEAALKKEHRTLVRAQETQQEVERLRRQNDALRDRVERTERRRSQYVNLRGIGDTTLTDSDEEENGSTFYRNDDIPDTSIYNGDEEFVRNPEPRSKYGNSGYVTNMKELEERRKRGEDTSFIPDIHVPKDMFPEETEEKELNSTVPSDDPYRSVHFRKRSREEVFEAEEAADTEDTVPEDAEMEELLSESPEPQVSYEKAYDPEGPEAEETEAAVPAARKPAPHSVTPKKAEAPVEPVQIPAVPEKEYQFPPYRLLKRGSGAGISKSALEKELKETAEKLQQTLKTFGVGVTITNISCGPTVTRYEILPEMGVKVSKVVSLTDDIKLNLAAADIRMEAPIPGKAAIGIEIPNKVKQSVVLRDLMESDAFKNAKSKLAFAAGRDLEGNVIIADIARMPHVLVAGATGSGKSVCINTMIMSIIYHAKPTEVKMIMVDPKVVELSVYNGIPHLLLPVVTDPKKAASALNWAVAEMEKRYLSFAAYGVRGIEGFNEMVDRRSPVDELGQPVRRMPQILIIVDELADLMMVAPGDVENAICRLAQKARAAGIHLVLATQRPSVDVITGLIKANIPSRIAFAVSSGTDSRTILDMNGAEKLLGRGDMLYSPAGSSKPTRVQGAFVSDDEVKAVVEYVSGQGSVQGGGEESIDLASQSLGQDSAGGADDRDEYFAQAGRLVIEKEKASIGMLQRAFRLGFNRAARIVDQLADAGVVGEEEGTKPRRVLMSMAQFEAYLNEQGEQ